MRDILPSIFHKSCDRYACCRHRNPDNPYVENVLGILNGLFFGCSVKTWNLDFGFENVVRNLGIL
ncbi:hypothetical protein LC607_25535 [Nostoc sp. CHAB 5824]|nr:hypothetical protein [Nostoc sp. CHAB 5824]